MTKQDKMIASFLIFQALAGAATVGWMAVNSPLPFGVWATLTPLIAAALIAGVGSFAARRWAVLLGMVVFALQVPMIATPGLRYSLWLGVHLIISVGWIGQANLGINLVAIAMLLWSFNRYSAPNNSFKPKPLRGSA